MRVEDRGTGGSLHGGAAAKLLVVLVVLFSAFSLAWMLFLPVVFTTQIRQRTGFDATVQSLVVNPFTGTVELRGLVVTNPPTYPVKGFLELRRFSANAEVMSLFSNRPVFTTMEIDVARVTLVKRDKSQTNAGTFSDYLTAAAVSTNPAVASARGKREFLIRRLVVRVDEVVIDDRSTSVPQVQDFKIALNQSYSDVSGVKQLLAPATLQSLLPLGAALNGYIPGALGGAVGDVVKEAAKTTGNLLKDAGKSTGEKIKGYFDALEESKKP